MWRVRVPDWAVRWAGRKYWAHQITGLPVFCTNTGVFLRAKA